MLKRLIKMFVKADTLARYSAEGLQKAVNGSGKAELIEKYGTMADKATDVQKKITEWLKDGRIEDLERDEIEAMLVPLFENVLRLF